jgi:hypothetical protein
MQNIVLKNSIILIIFFNQQIINKIKTVNIFSGNVKQTTFTGIQVIM